MIKYSIKGLFVLMVAMVSFVSPAEIKILPIQSAGITEELKKTAESLVKISVMDAGYTVDTTACPLQLNVSVVRLEQTIIVSAEKIEKGKTVFSTRLKAASVDELDLVIERAVGGALKGVAATDNEEIGKVTQIETTAMTVRKEAQTYYVLGGGFSAYHGMHVKETNFAYTLQFGYILEVTQHIALTAILAGSLLSAELGGDFEMLAGSRWLFLSGRYSPYIAAGIGYGLSGNDYDTERSVRGLAGNFSAGCVMFRTSKVQSEISLQYTIIRDDRHDNPPIGRFSFGGSVNFGAY